MTNDEKPMSATEMIARLRKVSETLKGEPSKPPGPGNADARLKRIARRGELANGIDAERDWDDLIQDTPLETSRAHLLVASAALDSMGHEASAQHVLDLVELLTLSKDDPCARPMTLEQAKKEGFRGNGYILWSEIVKIHGWSTTPGAGEWWRVIGDKRWSLSEGGLRLAYSLVSDYRDEVPAMLAVEPLDLAMLTPEYLASLDNANLPKSSELALDLATRAKKEPKPETRKQSSDGTVFRFAEKRTAKPIATEEPNYPAGRNRVLDALEIKAIRSDCDPNTDQWCINELNAILRIIEREDKVSQYVWDEINKSVLEIKEHLEKPKSNTSLFAMGALAFGGALLAKALTPSEPTAARVVADNDATAETNEETQLTNEVSQ
jgi:hypothetical protein